MAVRRHSVHKLDLSRIRSLDERFWPAQLSIWLLTVYVVALYGWQAIQRAPAGGHRQWIVVASVAAIGVFFSLAVALIPPRRLRRGLVVALCLSLALNLSLMVGLSHIRLVPPNRITATPPQPKAEERPPRTFEEYYPLALDGDDRPQQAERQPLSTGEPELKRRDMVRKTSSASVEPLPLQAEAVPQNPMPPSLAVIQREDVIESAPRHFETQGTLSRQSLVAQPALGDAGVEPAPVSPPVPAQRLQAADATVDQMRQPVVPDPSSDAALTTGVQPTMSATIEPRPDIAAAPEVARPTSTIDRRRSENLPSMPTESDVPVTSSATELVPSSVLAEANAAVTVQVPQRPTQPEGGLQSEPDEPNVPNDVQVDVERRDVTELMPSVAALAGAPVPRQSNHLTKHLPTDVDVPRNVAERGQATTRAATPTSRPEAGRPTRREPQEILPAPADLVLKPREALAVTGEETNADDLGRAELASEPGLDISMKLAGNRADAMSAPRIDAQPSLPSQRQRVTGQPRRVGEQIELPQITLPALPSVELPQPRSESSTRQDRSGSATIPEIVVQPGGAPVEIGGTLSTPADSRPSAGAAGVPTIVSSAAQRLTTSQTPGGDFRPALPIDIARPELSVPAERLATPSVTKLSSHGGQAPLPPLAPSPDLTADAEEITDVPTTRPPDTMTSRQFVEMTNIPDPVPTLPDAPQGGSPVSVGRPSTRDMVAMPDPTLSISNHDDRVAALPAPSAAAGSAASPTSPADEQVSVIVDALETSDTSESLPRTPAVPPRRVQRWQGVVPSSTDPRPAETVSDIVRPPTLIVPQRDVTVDSPTVAARRMESQSQDAASMPAPERGQLRRQTGALLVDVDSHPGIGGLSSDISSDVGFLQRQAQPDSDQIADSVGRFIRRPVGGPLSISHHVPVPARAYQTRINRRGERPVGGNGRPSPRTEEAIELGLLYLAEHQRADGSWSLAEAGDRDSDSAARRLTIRSDTAATGLALLSFLGAGYHHRTDTYGNVVRDGLEYLIGHQQANGDLYQPMDETSNLSAWLYSHAIASIALSEAFGMTQDPDLRGPAQRSIDFIVDAQHPQRGGWRYQPGIGSDTSVSGWMVMALRSAELANLAVPVETWRRVDQWLDLAKASEGQPELYRYNPFAPNTVTQSHGRRPTTSITAVGLLMRLYTGWRREDVSMRAGADYLLDNLPEHGSLRDPQRDTYYWYYATQVMFHMGGKYWERWNQQLHELLTSTQQQIGPQAGSWDPWSPIPDRWAPHAGRLYVTTMNLLSLEVFYRHLPIYEDTAR